MPVYEIETVDVAPGAVPRWLELSRQMWTPPGDGPSSVLGVFRPVFGRWPQIVVLHEHADDAALGARLAGAMPSARRRPETERAGVQERADCQFLVPDDRWPRREVQADGVFVLRRYRVRADGAEEFMRLTAEEIWPNAIDDPDQGDYVGLWVTATQDRGTVVLMTRYRDLAHWQGSRPAPDASANSDAFWLAIRRRDEVALTTEAEVLTRLPGVAALVTGLAGNRLRPQT